MRLRSHSHLRVLPYSEVSIGSCGRPEPANPPTRRRVPYSDRPNRAPTPGPKPSSTQRIAVLELSQIVRALVLSQAQEWRGVPDIPAAARGYRISSSATNVAQPDPLLGPTGQHGGSNIAIDRQRTHSMRPETRWLERPYLLGPVRPKSIWGEHWCASQCLLRARQAAQEELST